MSGIDLVFRQHKEEVTGALHQFHQGTDILDNAAHRESAQAGLGRHKQVAQRVAHAPRQFQQALAGAHLPQQPAALPVMLIHFRHFPVCDPVLAVQPDILRPGSFRIQSIAVEGEGPVIPYGIVRPALKHLLL